MRTTINIPDDMIQEIMKYTHSKSRTDAVNKALHDWVYHQKLNRFLELRGKTEFDHIEIDNITEKGNEELNEFYK